MGWNTKRTAVFYDKEILRGAGGLDDVMTAVVDATTVPENPASSGRYVLEAGTVLAKITASTKVKPAVVGGGSGGAGAYVAADIVGILADTWEFTIGQGITASAASDEAVGYLWQPGLHFNVSKLVYYSANAAAVQTAMPGCRFD